MIGAHIYIYIYLMVVSIITIYKCITYSRYPASRIQTREETNSIGTLFLMLFMALFIGSRPISYEFIDMGGYAALWDMWDMGEFQFSRDVQNILFDNLRSLMSTNHIDIFWFFLLISAIYFGAMYVACRKLFPYDTLLAYVVCLGAFSTFSYATNGIKAGAAASLFLVAIAYRDNLKIAIPFALISLGFHHSMIMVVFSAVIAYIFRKPQPFFLLWGICVIIAALEITTFQDFFASIADEQGQKYLMSDYGVKGFRYDFILYSAMPVLIGFIAVYKKKIHSTIYCFMLNLYLLTNSVWMLCMYASFTNRIAYLSWFFYPIVLIYPFLNEKFSEKQYRSVARISIAHLGFTLFMLLVFYKS